jgi:hypothetical protein
MFRQRTMPLPKAPSFLFFFLGSFMFFFYMAQLAQWSKYVQVSKFIVPHALQVHFVFRAGGGGGGSSRPGMPETFERIREKSPEQMALKLLGIQKFPFGKCKFLFFKREQSPTT